MSPDDLENCTPDETVPVFCTSIVLESRIATLEKQVAELIRERGRPQAQQPDVYGPG